jgi:hypothetical protein
MRRLCERVSDCVFEAADGFLNLAFYLVGLALRFQLGVTDGLADRLLDCAFDFLRRSGDRSSSMISSSNT